MTDLSRVLMRFLASLTLTALVIGLALLAALGARLGGCKGVVVVALALLVELLGMRRRRRAGP